MRILPGQVYDSESGLFQNHHREYQGLGGRYLTPDPIGLAGGSMSLYNYVNGQPTRYIDPKGLAIWICNRKAWGSDAGVNHAYLWDDTSNQCCGMNRPHDPIKTCKEKGPIGGDSCTLVSGSTGKESQVMNCCSNKASKSWWPKYDCHDLANECVTDAGLKSPGAPGGRFGECGSCSK